MSWVITGSEKTPVDKQGIQNVSLLLHGNGTNGSTTITDSSPSPKTVTAVGNAQISTAQSKFGGSSFLLDGNGDYINVAPNPVFSFNSDFTVEAWVYPLSISNKYDAVFTLNRVGNWNGGNGFGLVLSVGNLHYDASNADYTSGNTPVNTWTHLAVARSGSAIKVFKNGTVDLTVSSTATLQDGVLTTPALGVFDGTRFYFNGYIDDLRITKGVARYTANFTPPTAPFPDI
jgi:hypothetical protein